MKNFTDRLSELVELRVPKTKEGKPKHTIFAEQLEIPVSTWSRIYNGKGDPDADTLVKIAQQTGCTLDWLMMGRGQPYYLDTMDEDEARLCGLVRELKQSDPTELEYLEAYIRVRVERTQQKKRPNGNNIK